MGPGAGGGPGSVGCARAWVPPSAPRPAPHPVCVSQSDPNPLVSPRQDFRAKMRGVYGLYDPRPLTDTAPSLASLGSLAGQVSSMGGVLLL